MTKMRWQVALDVLTVYHKNAEIGRMVGVSGPSVSGWRNGRHEPEGVRKRKLVAKAEERYPSEFKRMEAENDG